MFYMEKFKTQEELINMYKEDGAYLCWVMALYLNQNDVFDLALTCLTDRSNDKKIDFIDLDLGLGKLSIAQGYYSQKEKDVSPSNKASDLNTAGAWLVSGSLDDIPEYLREIIKDCREAIDNDEVSIIELLYVHNLSESENCRKELETAAKHLETLLKSKSKDIEVGFQELGKSSIENLYIEKESQIIIKDPILIDSKPFHKEKSEDWEASLFSVSGKWLSKLYKDYGEKLFTANYRGFLGVGKRKKINNEIRQTGESNPKNFWVYNNGITILTHEINKDKIPNATEIKGISIINGAQTTGSIGMIENDEALKSIKVLCRIIKVTNPKIINNIVRANNRQNEITSWDIYANDEKQKSLQEKFAMYGKSYSLKRGFDDFNNGLGIYTVAQPTLAFEGNYNEANRGKNNIFLTNSVYKSVFSKETKARHLLLTYTLSKAIDQIKFQDKSELSRSDTISKSNQNKLKFFRNLKFKMFFIALIGNTLESFIDNKVDKKSATISQEWAKKPIDDIVDNWLLTVNSVLNILANQIAEDDINEYINDKDKFDDLSKKIATVISVVKLGNTSNYDSLKSMIWNG